MHAIRSRRTVLPRWIIDHNSSNVWDEDPTCSSFWGPDRDQSELAFADATIFMDSVKGCIVSIEVHKAADLKAATDEEFEMVGNSHLPPGCTFEDVGALVVMAGLVDPYVSFGQNCMKSSNDENDALLLECADEWDGFEFGTKVSD